MSTPFGPRLVDDALSVDLYSSRFGFSTKCLVITLRAQINNGDDCGACIVTAQGGAVRQIIPRQYCERALWNNAVEATESIYGATHDNAWQIVVAKDCMLFAGPGGKRVCFARTLNRR